MLDDQLLVMQASIDANKKDAYEKVKKRGYDFSKIKTLLCYI